MRHSHRNDTAKLTCRMRRATQSTLRTGGAQVEHPYFAALGRLTILKCVTALSDHLWNLTGFSSGVIAALIAAVLQWFVCVYPCPHLAPQEEVD